MLRGEEDWIRNTAGMLLHIAIGAGLALIVSIIFLLMAALGISMGWLHESMMQQLVAAACILGAFVGGLSAVKSTHCKRMLVGISVGALMFCLLFIIGFVIYAVREPGKDSAAIAVSCLCGGALSGALGSRKGPKGKRIQEGRKRKARR